MSSDLVRIAQDPHWGLIICKKHMRELAEGGIFAHEEIPAAQISFWAHRCTMCGFDAVPDRECENQSCRRPLHPQWPAVYCSNLCASEDL